MSQPQQIPSRCELDPDGLILRLELVVPSDPRLIDDFVMKTSSLLSGAPCGDALQAVELALHEALANAVVHGNHNDPAKAVRLCLAVREGCGIEVVVKDVGAGFDRDQLPSPVAEGNLLASHGRGIFLMKHLMDEVDFRFDGGTEIRLQRRGATDTEAEPVVSAPRKA
ncbi:MAG TPA: ATP-binding protein [Candidatus Xenobia bacterium]|nr:ATP-binding protein [Candidatus Xenobia bacterium]